MARPRLNDETEILRAARTVFVRFGPAATTRDVAEAAGVSQALLFQRWGTKERLFFAAMLPPAPSLGDLLSETNAGSTALDRLVAIAGRLLRWLEDAMPGGLRAALHPRYPDALAAAHGSAGVDDLRSALAWTLSELRSEGQLAETVDVEASARALLDLLHGIALRRTLGDRLRSSEDEAREAVTAVWNGLKPP